MYQVLKSYSESGGIAPRILILSTRWGWVIRFVPHPLFTPGKESPLPTVYENGRVQNR